MFLNQHVLNGVSLPADDWRQHGDKQMNDENKAKVVAKNNSEEKCYVQLYGAPHIDLFEFERLRLPGVTLQLRFYRPSNLLRNKNLTALSAADVEDFKKRPHSDHREGFFDCQCLMP